MRGMRPPTDPRTALLAAVLASAATLVVLVGYLLAAGALTVPRAWSSDLAARLAGQFVGIYALGALATVGVPVALYLRYGLVAPFVVLAADVAFWTFLAGEGDAPRAFFVVALWPAYLLAHLAVAGVEWYLRSRGVFAGLAAG